MTAIATVDIHPMRVTPEELLRLPDGRSLELVFGRPVEKGESYLASRTEARIVHLLEGHTQRHPTAVVCTSGMIYQCFQGLAEDPGRMRRPDVSVIRADRFRSIGEANPGVIRIPPDLAVEVVSTHDRVAAVDDKLAEYEAGGFPLVWVVNPVRRTVTVQPFPGEPSLLTGDDELRAESALPGFACRASDLFPPAA